jgi:type III secretion protein T
MNSDYLLLYFKYPYPESLLYLFLLSLFRIAPVIPLAPFFGAKLMPGMAKVGLAVSISVIMLPHLMLNTKGPILFDMGFVGYALKEAFIGYLLGFMISIPFFIANSAGTLIDNQRGAASLQVSDPALSTQVSPIGLFYNYILIVLFYMIDGPYHFLDALSRSYVVVPIDQFIQLDFFRNIDSAFWQIIVHLLQQVMTISIQLAAPALVAILMADLFLGIANRLATQVPMSFLGMSLKSLLGVAILWTGWWIFLKQIEKESFDWLSGIDRLIETLKVI